MFHCCLGRPFLAIGVALIDVNKRELALRMGDEAMHFNLNLSHPLTRPYVTAGPDPGTRMAKSIYL